MTARADVFDRMTALADPTRARVLLLLERHELTVSEIGAVAQLPQSTTSRQLRILGDEGWVTSRAEGTSRLYSMAAAQLDPSARALWNVVRGQIADAPAARQDARRLESVLAERRSKSQQFFSASAGQWDRLRSELFGTRTDLTALLGLLDPTWTVGDLGCGTGQLTATLAPFVQRVLAVDESSAMLTAARKRLAPLENVEIRKGSLEELPVRDGELDVAVLLLVLHHIAEPAGVLTEAARALRSGGRLLVVDMMPHEREEYRQQMGHIWLGFAESQLGPWFADAGFERTAYRPLPADPQAKGPTLFAATARRTKREA